jgi:hypothetical protein
MKASKIRNNTGIALMIRPVQMLFLEIVTTSVFDDNDISVAI